MSNDRTYLGYKNDDGFEMHCAHDVCPNKEKCNHGCAERIAKIPPPLNIVTKLHDGRPSLQDIPGRLRTLADDLERGEYQENGPITSCLVVFAQPLDEWPIMFGYGDMDGNNNPLITLQLALQKWINKLMVRG